MTVHSVTTSDDIYYVDTKMLGHDEHMAAYLIDGERTVIIDPGLSTATKRILDALDELGVEPTAVDDIVLTHIHLDHAGAAGFLAEACPDANVYCHEVGIDFLVDENELQKLVSSVHRAVGDLADRYGTAKPIPRERFKPLSGDETIDLGDRSLDVIHATGHAPHQVCLYCPEEKVLFTADECGEYLGGDLHPTTPPPNFNLEANLASLDTLASFDVEALLYPHFGPRYEVDGVFTEYACVLQEWVEEVTEQWMTHRDVQRVVQEFVERGDNPNFELWESSTAAELTRMDIEGTLRYVRQQSQ